MGIASPLVWLAWGSTEDDRQHGGIVHGAFDHVCRQYVGDGGQGVRERIWGGHASIVFGKDMRPWAGMVGVSPRIRDRQQGFWSVLDEMLPLFR